MYIAIFHIYSGFAPDFKSCVDQIVTGTLELYKGAMASLLPTPTKSHYLFNLRDFARVVQGVLLSVPETMEEPSAMKRLWLHEVSFIQGMPEFYILYKNNIIIARNTRLEIYKINHKGTIKSQK